MALIEFKNLPDTSTPLTAENLNNNFNLLSNMMTVKGADENITTTADSQRQKIKLDEITNSIGDKLTFDDTNDGIRIGAGVSYVSVSCGCAVSQKSSGMTYQTLSILKNGNQQSVVAQARGQYSPDIYSHCTLADILIPVQQNDLISMGMFNRLAGTIGIYNKYLTVKVIA